MPVLSPCTTRPGSARSSSPPTRRSPGAGTGRGRPSSTDQLGEDGGRAAALTFDGGARRLPRSVEVPGADRPQRHPAGRLACRRRLGGDQRGAEVPRREPQDPRHPRPGGQRAPACGSRCSPATRRPSRPSSTPPLARSGPSSLLGRPAWSLVRRPDPAGGRRGRRVAGGSGPRADGATDGLSLFVVGRQPAQGRGAQRRADRRAPPRPSPLTGGGRSFSRRPMCRVRRSPRPRRPGGGPG